MADTSSIETKLTALPQRKRHSRASGNPVISSFASPDILGARFAGTALFQTMPLLQRPATGADRG
jgi:hypothetical protein